ncbi:beta strand repeat-containing protein [Roseococcus sp. DSY-14]|uniref:beta strand repeat-containing protein n=1 Tax=Roseococcus sp. DSY-14 TaxID=3369650 RepID=UPI00387AE195
MSGTVLLPQMTAVNASDITGVILENAGAGVLAAGVATFGQTFVAGDLPAGAALVARIGGVDVPVQVDAKTFNADGSVKFAVLSIERPALAAGESLEVALRAAPAAPAAPAIDLASALAGRSLVVEVTPAGGGAITVDVLAALKGALAAGTASFWQQGELASEARVTVDLPGSQRLVVDVTVFKDGEYSATIQFNNDEAMTASGGTVSYQAVVRMDGVEVDRESVTQAQYQNWRGTYASSDANGGQGLGEETAGWLNIQHDVAYLQASGAVARFDLTLGLNEGLLDRWNAATDAATWGAPLSNNGVTMSMGMTGGREDIGIVTAANAGWLITQDARAAEYAMGQADAAAAVPWNMYDTANGTWLNTDNYPKLWTDARGGTGTPGNANSGGLTQQISWSTGWGADRGHQPELSFVPYVMTGERQYLDTLMAQASYTIMTTWGVNRQNGDALVAKDNQVRTSAWSLRQVENAAWAAPEGSEEQAYFRSVSDGNWKWLVSQIPAWTAMQGEAHGWVPGAYGTAGSMAPWQQDYFASTTISAASRGNADALTFLQWQSNFLVGRFMQEAKGFPAHDGVAYNLAISPTTSSVPYTTWAQIAAETAARGQSNGDGWSMSVGDYARLGAASLAGIYLLTGNTDALDAYKMLALDSANGMGKAIYAQNPQFAVTVNGIYAGLIGGTAGDDTIEPRSGGTTLEIDLGGGFDTMLLGAGNNAGTVANVEVLIGKSGTDNMTVTAAAGGTLVDLGTGTDTLTLNGGRFTVVNVERILGGAAGDDVTLMDRLTGGAQLDLGGGDDVARLADGGNVALLRNVETAIGGTGNDEISMAPSLGGLVNAFADLGAGTDVLRFASSSANSVTVRNTETVIGNMGADDVTLGTAMAGGLVDLAGNTDTLRLADAANALTIANVENLIGGSAADDVTVTSYGANARFDLGAGADVLRLAMATGTVPVLVANAETILGAAANEQLTLLTLADGTLVDLGLGADTIRLADGTNRVTLRNIETVTGGTGADEVTLGTAITGGTTMDLGAGADVLRLAAGGNRLTARNVETLLGGSGADDVTLGTAAVAGDTVDLGAGTDVLRLANTPNYLTILGVETLTGSGGVDDITLGQAVAGFTADLSGGLDVVRLAAGTNSLSLANVDTILGNTGDDAVTILGTTTVTVLGGGGTDRVTLSGGTRITLSDVEVLAGSGGADDVTVTSAAAGATLDLGAGADRLTLATAAAVAVTVSGAETITGGAAAEAVTLRTSLATGSQVDLGGGTDQLQLAHGGNLALLRNVEAVLGGTGNDDVTLATAALPGTTVDLGGGADTLRLNGPTANTVLAANVEAIIATGLSADAITLATAIAGGSVDLGGGNDVLRLANGANTLTVRNVEALTGGSGADDVTVAASGSGAVFDLGAGADVLRLAHGGYLSVLVANAEAIFGGAFDEMVTVTTAMNGVAVDLGGGNDRLVMADTANTVVVRNVETVTGGAGADDVTLASAMGGGTVDLRGGNDVLRMSSGPNTLTALNVETILGWSAADTITLGTTMAGGLVDLGGGADRLQLANGTNSLTVLNVETVLGHGGADTVTLGTAALTGTTVDLGGGADVLRLGNFANVLSVANTELVVGGALDDRITATGSMGARLEGGLGNDVLVGGTGGDRLVGGAGRDTMTGGTGGDWFIFRAAADSAAGTPDVITDFNSTLGDRIAFEGMGSGAGFAYRGAGSFVKGTAPQARFTDSTDRLEVDFNGDAVTDLAVTLQGVALSNLSSASFIWS